VWIFNSEFIDLERSSTVVVERQTGAKLERTTIGHEMVSMIRSRLDRLFGYVLADCCQLEALPDRFSGRYVRDVSTP
jgi:hypothetical protein